jgi:non-ribosomal peptide synthetase component F
MVSLARAFPSSTTCYSAQLSIFAAAAAAGPSDVFCLNSTVCFDSYVTYVFASLVLGAKLVVPGPTAHLDPYGMAALIAAQRISCMEVVPALAAEYLGAFRDAGDSIACLKYMLTGANFWCRQYTL